MKASGYLGIGMALFDVDAADMSGRCDNVTKAKRVFLVRDLLANLTEENRPKDALQEAN